MPAHRAVLLPNLAWLRRRGFVRTLCRVLAAMLLSTQLALAAYACPGAAAAGVAAASEFDTGTQPLTATPADCEDRIGAGDPAYAALCAEHCQADPQNGQPPPLPLPAVLLVALYRVVPPEAAWPAPPAAPVDADRGRAGQPPHTIVHCCRRN